MIVFFPLKQSPEQHSLLKSPLFMITLLIIIIIIFLANTVNRTHHICVQQDAQQRDDGDECPLECADGVAQSQDLIWRDTGGAGTGTAGSSSTGSSSGFEEGGQVGFGGPDEGYWPAFPVQDPSACGGGKN